MLCIIAMNIFQLEAAEYKTLAVCLTAITAFMILFQVSLPFNKIRTALFVLMVSGMTIGVLCCRDIHLFGIHFDLFNFAAFSWTMAILLAVLTAIALLIFILLTLPMKKLFANITAKFEGRTFRPENT